VIGTPITFYGWDHSKYVTHGCNFFYGSVGVIKTQLKVKRRVKIYIWIKIIQCHCLLPTYYRKILAASLV
jgi:hypothetical protein